VETPRWLRLELRTAQGVGDLPTMTVIAEGVEVGTRRLESGRRKELFELPDRALEVSADDPRRIEILFDPPLPRVGKPLTNLIGLALGDETAVSRRLVRTEPVAVDSEAETVRVDESGVWVVPLADVTGSVGLEVHCPLGAVSIRLEVLDSDGASLASRAVETEACIGGWVEQRLEADAEARGWGNLAVEVVTAHRPAGVLLRNLTQRAAAKERERSPAADDQRHRRTAATRPDVVMVILDAARADHFGAYGYGRNTTPAIDGLAAEGLVFERAYSECPNTTCSVPNLITGVPFMNLGTVFRGRKVPDEVVTLAEYLKPLGYRTVGLSANPNNSASRNSHQGFETFERLWGAHRQAELAVEKIAAQPPDEPLYLQLHFLPPHKPYMPAPEFDLFTDPEYRGPVHPKIELHRYLRGGSTLSPADLAQLVALYDGNLRMADDAVARVVEALRASARWESTLFVLTSDHGEAFGEHGHFQHDGTLFDEMLHVPLILRLPGGEVPAGVDTFSPAALADVVPTVLGYLGLTPRPEVWGLDLLTRATDEGAERFLYHRTNHRERPLLAIRGERWKAITGLGVRTPMLFDLVADAEERTDLSAAMPHHFAGLAARLRDFLVDCEERIPAAVEDVELSEKEVELLRSLGYVE
jgi:arylsulfatase A-like enzyme